MGARFVPRELLQNAVMGVPALQQWAMRFHATGMNDDATALEAGWGFYRERANVRGKRVLELGPGRSLQLLLRAQQAGATTCAALDVVAYPDAQALAAAHGLDFQTYNGRQFPYADGAFDVVWSTDVLEHVAQPDLVLAECARVLAPGGVCIARIDLRDHLFLDRRPQWLECLRYSDGLWRRMTSNRSTYVNRLRDSAWQRVFQSAGLEVTALHRERVDETILQQYRGEAYLAGYSDADLATYRIDVTLTKPRLD